MRRGWKRGLAFVCAAVMLIQTITIGGDWLREVFAANAPEQTEWYFLEGESAFDISSSKQFTFKKENAAINLPDGLTKENLDLCFTIYVPELKADGSDNSAALAAMKKIVVRISQTKTGNSMIHMNLTGKDFVNGFELGKDNQVKINLAHSDWQGILGSSDAMLDLTETIKAVQIYSTQTGMTNEEAVVKDIKLVDNRESGMAFGDSRTDDTYLQLSESLTATPTTVEASIKSDTVIVEQEAEDQISSWVLRAGGDTTNMSGGLKPSANNITTGTTVATDPMGAGQSYVAFTASSSTTFTAYNNFATPIDVSEYDKSELAVKMWIYSDKAGKLFHSGRLRLSNVDTGADAVSSWEYIPSVSGNDAFVLQAGWNEIVMPLDTGWTTYQGTGTGAAAFDWNAGIKSIRLHGMKPASGNSIEGATIKLCEIQLVEIKVATEAAPAPTVTMTAVDAKNLADQGMILSNTNNAAEENPYALFVTGEGYPALLWGNKQFTLSKNVFTGEWVDIAVVRDTDGYINFYIDGEFIAKSSETVPAMAAPKTAHSIGADGSGGQIFAGRIADVRVWDDVRTADEIKNNRTEKVTGVRTNGFNKNTDGLLGSWYLAGDIQYVLETMPDVSKHENTVVFKGARADDWVDFTIPEEIGDDYWTVVFVPDIQNLTDSVGGKWDYVNTWKQMGQWIADNIEKENIQHVISAGDSTWTNSDVQYANALLGFEQFMNLVSWSANIGNHDYAGNATDRNSTRYQQYFGLDTVQGSAAATTYAGSFEDSESKTTTENSYYRFNVNGKNWMIMQLEYNPRASVLTWAKEVVNNHANDNVILTTHSYLNSTGAQTNAGAAIWNALKDCTNIKMILCGHAHNETGVVVERIETNSNGDEVPALMINAQDLDGGNGNREVPSYYTTKPLGMLGILRFSKDGSKVALQYYSPTSEKSFSPEWNGVADSNSHMYDINAKSCTHKDAANKSLLIKINENAVTSTTNGYSGDMYCTECATIVEYGVIVKADSKSWVLREGGITTDLIGGLKDTDMNVYTTDEDDSPGKGLDCVQFTSGTKTFTSVTKGLDIDASKYELSDLAVTFWCYSETEGSLFTGGRLRLSNGKEGADKEANLDYAASEITVKAGWNKITIPLDQWKAFSTSTDKAFTLLEEIDTFRFHGCTNKDAKEIILGEVELVVVEKSDTENTTTDNSGIATGDAANLTLWMSLLLCAMVTMVYIISKRKTHQ